MIGDGFGFIDFGSFGQEPEKPKKEKEEGQKHSSKRRTTACVELSTRYEYRRAFSEMKLLDACGKFDFTEGVSYHFITAGDVDSLSFLKAVLRQQNVRHLIVSTWCMAAEDILQLKQWHQDRKIDTLDLYVGEIFPGSYSVEWQMLKDWQREDDGLQRLCVFRNHSKVYAGEGEKFPFIIETSANINTNPRTEQGVITIDGGGYAFYKQYFDGIESFE